MIVPGGCPDDPSSGTKKPATRTFETASQTFPRFITARLFTRPRAVLGHFGCDGKLIAPHQSVLGMVVVAHKHKAILFKHAL